MDQNCELIQYNKGNIQPIHVILSDKSQAATASEIIEVNTEFIGSRRNNRLLLDNVRISSKWIIIG